MKRHPCLIAAVALACASLPCFAGNTDVYGIQAAAIEMPHTAVLLRRPSPPTAPDQIIPLNVSVEDPLDPGIERNEYAFEAFLDTGTSGVLISREFYEFLGVQQQLDSGNNPVSFFDVTVDGEKEFHVSEPLYISIAPFPLTSEPEYNDLVTINQVFTPPTLVRAQLATDLVDGGLFGAEPRNVVGMPAMAGKVVKVDSTAYNHLSPDSEEFPSLLTTIHNPGDAAIPAADHTIKVSYANFSAYTRVSPDEPGVVGPTLAANPIIGASPLDNNPPADAPPGVSIFRDDPNSPSTTFSSQGNWLLDTGAQISFMSSEQARALNIGVTDVLGITALVDLTTDELIEDQFFVPISGADPSSISFLPGFILDRLQIPTTEGSITWHDVPILIVDVYLEDALGNVLLLDGDIGMNLFLPSMGIEGEPAVTSSFDYMVFDQPAGELRLTVTVPEPASLGVLGVLAVMMCRRRRFV